jgi:hypothetical protein
MTGFIVRGQDEGKSQAVRHKKFTVSTQLTENTGTYEQRKLYREFLVEFMKNCPYISDFNIRETPEKSDNRQVEWTYEVNGWKDLTAFYGWVTDQLKSKDEGLKKALTPYWPDYSIGGKITLKENSARDNNRPRMALDKINERKESSGGM